MDGPRRAPNPTRRTSCSLSSTTWGRSTGLLRQPDRHPAHRCAGRRRAALRQHAHYGTVLSVAVLHSQRAQPSFEPPGLPHQRVHRISGLGRLHPVRERFPLRDSEGVGLQHLLRRKVASGARGNHDRAGPYDRWPLPTVSIALVALAISPLPPLLPTREAKAGGGERYGLGLMVVLAERLIGLAFDRKYVVSPGAIAVVTLMSILLTLLIGMMIRALAIRISTRVRTAGNVLIPVAAVVLLIADASDVRRLVGNGTVWPSRSSSWRGLRRSSCGRPGPRTFGGTGLFGRLPSSGHCAGGRGGELPG